MSHTFAACTRIREAVRSDGSFKTGARSLEPEQRYRLPVLFRHVTHR